MSNVKVISIFMSILYCDANLKCKILVFRHSKNNTALAFFTKSEFEKLDYGTKRERLGRDSMRDFNSCFLCLQISRDPLCWYFRVSLYEDLR